MTPQDSNAAWDKWVASAPFDDITLKEELASRKDNLELWLRAAFFAGIKARESKDAEARWPESAVEADRQQMHEMGVLWP